MEAKQQCAMKTCHWGAWPWTDSGDFPKRVTLNKMIRTLLFLVRSKLMRTRKQNRREELSHAQMSGSTVVLEWLEGETGYGTAE